MAFKIKGMLGGLWRMALGRVTVTGSATAATGLNSVYYGLAQVAPGSKTFGNTKTPVFADVQTSTADGTILIKCYSETGVEPVSGGDVQIIAFGT